MASSDRTPGGQFTSASASESLGWAVGRLSWLNSAASEVSRYWRTIEFGNADMVGRFLGGVWINGPRAADSRLAAGGDVFGVSNQQSFVPFNAEMRTESDAIRGARAALYFLYKQDRLGEDAKANRASYFSMVRRLKSGDTSRIPTFGQIHKAIQGREAYTKALESFNPAQAQREVIAEVFAGMGFTSGQRRRQKASITGRKLSARIGGALQVSVTSGYNRSLLGVDKQFQSELIKANRLLAIGFQERVAGFYEDMIRPDISTGLLAKAHMAPENRFPQ